MGRMYRSACSDSNCYITADGTAPGPELPYTNVVLVNPNQALPTADVYKAYKNSGAAFSKISQFAKPPNDGFRSARGTAQGTLQ